jgi:putative hydrolase of the HAD superfamily
MVKPVILCDFDGTLATRTGGWADAIATVVNREHDAGLTADAVRPYLQNGFPWHLWQTPHAQLMPGLSWWQYVTGILTRSLADLGIPPEYASRALAQLPDEYVRADAFVVYDDVIPALTMLTCAGYRCCIASNHTP